MRKPDISVYIEIGEQTGVRYTKKHITQEQINLLLGNLTFLGFQVELIQLEGSNVTERVLSDIRGNNSGSDILAEGTGTTTN